MTAETTAATGTPDTETPNAANATATNPTDANAAGEGTPRRADGEQTGGDGEQAKTEGAPESYEAFTVPEGMALDAELTGSMGPLFKEANLTQAQAQKLVDAYAAHVGKLNEGGQAAFDKAYGERQATERAKQSDDWLNATKADKEIGGDKFDAVKSRVIEAIGAVGTAEGKQAFNEQGWGNHPELIRLVNRLIDYTPQDRGERGSSGGDNPLSSLEDRLYPNERK